MKRKYFVLFLSIRYAEFNCVKNGKISKTGMFIDVIGVMEAAGEYPLPPSTGHYFVYPGPRSHDGILIEDAPAEEADKTFERASNFLYLNFVLLIVKSF